MIFQNMFWKDFRLKGILKNEGKKAAFITLKKTL